MGKGWKLYWFDRGIGFLMPNYKFPPKVGGGVEILLVSDAYI